MKYMADFEGQKRLLLKAIGEDGKESAVFELPRPYYRALFFALSQGGRLKEGEKATVELQPSQKSQGKAGIGQTLKKVGDRLVELRIPL